MSKLAETLIGELCVAINHSYIKWGTVTRIAEIEEANAFLEGISSGQVAESEIVLRAQDLLERVNLALDSKPEGC